MKWFVGGLESVRGDVGHLGAPEGEVFQPLSEDADAVVVAEVDDHGGCSPPRGTPGFEVLPPHSEVRERGENGVIEVVVDEWREGVTGIDVEDDVLPSLFLSVGRGVFLGGLASGFSLRMTGVLGVGMTLREGIIVPGWGAHPVG